MTRRFLINMALAAVFASIPVHALAVPKGWEQVKAEMSDVKQVVKETEIEIKTAPYTIVVSSSKQIRIEVFTILGRLVSSETLPPGTSRFNVGAHGVYIIKVGELTCKVAI